MTKPLSSQELVRLSWLTELRRQGHRQCKGWGSEGKACALHTLDEVTGGDVGRVLCYEQAGLSHSQAAAVAAMNDGDSYGTASAYRKHTFAEIADVVEGWFKK